MTDVWWEYSHIPNLGPYRSLDQWSPPSLQWLYGIDKVMADTGLGIWSSGSNAVPLVCSPRCDLYSISISHDYIAIEIWTHLKIVVDWDQYFPVGALESPGILDHAGWVIRLDRGAFWEKVALWGTLSHWISITYGNTALKKVQKGSIALSRNIFAKFYQRINSI